MIKTKNHTTYSVPECNYRTHEVRVLVNVLRGIKLVAYGGSDDRDGLTQDGHDDSFRSLELGIRHSLCSAYYSALRSDLFLVPKSVWTALRFVFPFIADFRAG